MTDEDTRVECCGGSCVASMFMLVDTPTFSMIIPTFVYLASRLKRMACGTCQNVLGHKDKSDGLWQKVRSSGTELWK